jgi:hypothetical protein
MLLAGSAKDQLGMVRATTIRLEIDDLAPFSR